jgi:hypothetical protein
MVEYVFYPMSIENMHSYPNAVRSISKYTYNANGVQGSGFYSTAKRDKKVTYEVEFFKSEGNLKETGYKFISNVDYTGFYIEKEKVNENDIINWLFGFTKVVFEFYETDKTVTGLGYVFRKGWGGKGYYRDKQVQSSNEGMQLKDMYVSPSINELGYKHGEFFCWDNKQGYYRLKPQNASREDIVKFLFGTELSVFPAYIASKTCFNNIPGYVFQNRDGKIGYHKEIQDCSDDTTTIHSWFKQIEKLDETSRELQRTLKEKNSEIQKLSLGLIQKEKAIEAMTKEKEIAFKVSKQVVNTLQQELKLAKSTIDEKDTVIKELEGVVQSLMHGQSSSFVETCELLRQQLQEKEKHISWLLTQLSKQTAVRVHEANLIDL